jgi:hypothetical protein
MAVASLNQRLFNFALWTLTGEPCPPSWAKDVLLLTYGEKSLNLKSLQRVL